MTAPVNPVLVILPRVLLGPPPGTPLDAMLYMKLKRVTVETHLQLPALFELTFVGVNGQDLEAAGVALGERAAVAVSPDPASQASPATLIRGEITAVEGVYEDFTGLTTVRGYDLGHRLQRARRTRAFLNTTDAKAAEKIAAEAGLEIGEITPSEVIHNHLPQYDQSDWEFLKQRASEIGYEFSLSSGVFCFRKASSVDSAGGEPVSLTLHKSLRAFAPRVTAGNLTPDVEVRVWDPLTAKVISGRAGSAAGTASSAGAQTSEEIAGVFSDPADGADPGPPPSPAVEDLGPPPSGTAFVRYDRPVAEGAATSSAAEVAAGGLADQLASTFAEAEGDTAGNAAIQAGGVVSVEGVPSQFPRTWVVTRARHLFDLSEGGYHTEFAATGRHDRSLLGLASLGATQAPLQRIPGVVCAVVTDINDESGHGRVKVTLPWLSPDYVSDWSPVIQFGAGPRSGGMFLPEVGDQVLVGFEFGDPRRAYVLGGVLSENSRYSLGGEAVSPDGTVVRRGFVSASGNLLAFYDQMPPGEGEKKPTASSITLGTADAALGLAIDIVAGKLTIACSQESPPGQLTIKCGDGGTVNIQAGQGGTMVVDGGDSLTIKAASSLTIQSSGSLSIQGQTISLG